MFLNHLVSTQPLTLDSEFDLPDQVLATVGNLSSQNGHEFALHSKFNVLQLKSKKRGFFL